MGTLTTRPSGWQVLKTTADVAGTPDTSFLSAPTTAFTVDAGKALGFDTLGNNSGGKNAHANNVEIIVTHSHATDADATTSVLELYGSNDSGPRMPLMTIACTGGKAERVAGVDEVVWVDTMVATTFHSKTITVTDSATDRIARTSFDLTGSRYIEGLFTGGGSTAVTAIAYIRSY